LYPAPSNKPHSGRWWSNFQLCVDSFGAVFSVRTGKISHFANENAEKPKIAPVYGHPESGKMAVFWGFMVLARQLLQMEWVS
jgi:hypothetical protein